jgi:hypothetical protein
MQAILLLAAQQGKGFKENALVMAGKWIAGAESNHRVVGDPSSSLPVGSTRYSNAFHHNGRLVFNLAHTFIDTTCSITAS